MIKDTEFAYFMKYISFIIILFIIGQSCLNKKAI